MMTSNVNPSALIKPNWDVPSNIHAVMTTRHFPYYSNQGMARGAYGNFNLATHVGDDLTQVKNNRQILCDMLALPTPPIWLEQVHSNKVVNATEINMLNAKADASVSAEKNVVCAVMTADCLPVLICSADGQKIAAIHAGWRGLANGIITHSINALTTQEVIVWFGAAIGKHCFEIGDDVRQIFIKKSSDYATAFQRHGSKWLADIYQLARIELAQLGIFNVYGGDYCTMRDEETFYSYRRDTHTGRMATLIWRT